jgi:hypothetical protein
MDIAETKELFGVLDKFIFSIILKNKFENHLLDTFFVLATTSRLGLGPTLPPCSVGTGGKVVGAWSCISTHLYTLTKSGHFFGGGGACNSAQTIGLISFNLSVVDLH